MSMLLLVACTDIQFPPSCPAPPPRLAGMVPLRAGHLTGNGTSLWSAYDTSDPQRLAQIQAALSRLKALGARQVVIEAPYAWTTEPVTDPAYQGFAQGNVIYRGGPPPTMFQVGTCQRDDMGLSPFAPPASWIAAGQVSDRAEAALRGVLQLATQAGLVPVLYLRNLAVPAFPSECSPCTTDEDCTSGQPMDSGVTCLMEPGQADGTCHADAGTTAYIDPSRDLPYNFTNFFAAYQDHALRMAALAAQSGAAMLVLGGGSPYLTGAGQASFAEMSTPMTTQKAKLTAGWSGVIDALRAQSGGLLLTYAAQDLFVEGRRRMQPDAPEWARIDFWAKLDAIGIVPRVPGRPGPLDDSDQTPMRVMDMVQYMETTGLVQSNGLYGNFQDMERFATAAGASIGGRPVLFFDDQVAAVPAGGALPWLAPAVPGDPIDFEEQRTFVEAHLLLTGQYAQHCWLGGAAWSVFPANVSGLGPAFGGMTRAVSPGFGTSGDYYGLFDTPAEATLRTYWDPALHTR